MANDAKLSILMASRRTGLGAISRIARACSWARPGIEVIVRDNSGDAQKREVLSRFRQDGCRIVVAEPSEALENYSETLKLASADFVFFLGDDDNFFDRSVPGILDLIGKHAQDPSIIGIAGAYAVEVTASSAILEYANVDDGDPVKRVEGYLAFQGPNILTYSPFRRSMFQRVFDFQNTLPSYFSFHDQLQSLMILLSGRFARMRRLLYVYEVGDWETPETAQTIDVEYYRREGFDPGINALHWFICGFEGAVLAMHSKFSAHLPQPQREAVAERWFSGMFSRFAHDKRLLFDSKLTDQAEKVRERLKTTIGEFSSFEAMLTVICHFMALSSPAKAESYFKFWDGLIKQRA